MRRLHSIEQEIIPNEIYYDEVYVWAKGPACTSAYWNHNDQNGIFSDNHHGCMEGVDYVYCECRSCATREERHYYEPPTGDYEYLCGNCEIGNHPKLPENMIWHV